MIQWKQRLYAFLLRRVLGPFLGASSSQKLHDSIDVSLQEGKFVLKDVCLDSTYLTEKLSEKIPGLSIRHARIDRLEINFSLRENFHNHDATATKQQQQQSATTTAAIPQQQSSFAWRAMKLGTMNESLPAVSLIAEVIIDGISLELEPIDRKRRRPPTKNSPKYSSAIPESKEEEASSKSVIGSYIDAALASLQLNLKLTNINIKLCQIINDQSSTKEVWMAMKISMFSYKELDVASSSEGVTSSPSTSSYKIVINKLVEFSEIVIQAGETHNSSAPLQDNPSLRSTVALAQGNGQIYYRVIEYFPPTSTNNNIQRTTIKDNTNNNKLQQDVEIKLNHQLNLSVDHTSMALIQTIANGFSDVSEPNTEGAELSAFQETSLRNNPHVMDDQDSMDREDLKALTGIMRQYREAYHLAEHNQLRGGILVPSNAYLDEGFAMEEAEDGMTFDVFFDANDQSYYNAASVLAESIRLSPDDDSPNSDRTDHHHHHVHTKLRLHLLSGCLKIVFRNPDQIRHYARPEEYLLMTMNDLSVSLSATQRSSEFSLSILNLDVEDAQFTKPAKSREFVSIGGSPVFEGAVEIGKILGFTSETGEEDDEYGEDVLLSQAPCVNVQWKKSKETDSKNDFINCNITMLPLEIFFRQRTMSNLSQFHTLIQKDTSASDLGMQSSLPSPKGEARAREVTVSLSCNCPSITFNIPLLQRVPTAPMFEESGEVLKNVVVRESSIGILLENVGFEFRSQAEKDVEEGSPLVSGKFSCQQLVCFVTCPEGDKMVFGTKMLRKDIFIATGRAEVNPYIPLSVTFIKTIPGGKDINPGRESFPIVPAISSFKARQEDDDEDIKTDSILFSKIGEVNADSRKELRGTDPQISMLTDAEKSDVVLTTHIPELMMDLTKKELGAFLQMVEATKPPDQGSATLEKKSENQFERSSQITSIAVNCDQISLSIREDANVASLVSKRRNVQKMNQYFLVCLLWTQSKCMY